MPFLGSSRSQLRLTTPSPFRGTILLTEEQKSPTSHRSQMVSSSLCPVERLLCCESLAVSASSFSDLNPCSPREDPRICLVLTLFHRHRVSVSCLDDDALIPLTYDPFHPPTLGSPQVHASSAHHRRLHRLPVRQPRRLQGASKHGSCG